MSKSVKSVDNQINEDEEEKVLQWHEMGLDGRLLKSISKLRWKEPTLIQEKAIPLSLEGKDILARGRTGSGKTAAFLIPILQQLLELKRSENTVQTTRCLILAPSKELCYQISSQANILNEASSREIRIVDIGGGGGSTGEADLRPLLAENPDIVIGTPKRILMHLKAKNLKNLKESLKFLVIDEADLMFSFGYEQDIHQVLESAVPSLGCQSFLISATLNPDVGSLKKLILRNPVILKLQESDLPQSEQLTQYHIKCEEEDKFVLLNALFKLKLIRGRTIIFVNNVDRSYKLKLFLEQFGTKTCILNSELPVTSRCFIVEQYNKGVYDIIIASDEKCLEDPKERKKKGKLSKKRNPDKEYGISRGLDFQFVDNVINFDFPSNLTSYIHRVGRTARGHRDAEGTVLSFISMAEDKRFKKVKESLGSDANMKPYQFRMEELEAFRYRARDALRSVTSIAVKEARLKEIKKEMMASCKLKAYFQDNPKDFKVLSHDKSLHTVKHKPHLKDVPEYIIPPTLLNLVRGPSKKTESSTVISGVVSHDVKKRKRSQNQSSNKRRSNDPLKSFKMN